MAKDEIKIAKELDLCIVHFRKIKGLNFVCPECGVHYCMPSIQVIKKDKNKCIYCGKEFEET